MSTSRVDDLAYMVADYDVYPSACAMLKEGFSAIKYNYNNFKKQHVVVRLSEDETHFTYEPQDPGSLEFLRPTRKMKLNEV